MWNCLGRAKEHDISGPHPERAASLGKNRLHLAIQHEVAHHEVGFVYHDADPYVKRKINSDVTASGEISLNTKVSRATSFGSGEKCRDLKGGISR